MLDDINIITQPAEEQLNDKQLALYRQHREKLARWALSIGKNPRKAEGYAHETVKRRLYRLDMFYRFIWEQEDGFTLEGWWPNLTQMIPSHLMKYRMGRNESDFSKIRKRSPVWT